MFLKKRYLAVSLILAVIYYINGLMGNFLLILFLAAGGALRWLPLLIALMLPAAAWLARLNIAEPLKASANFPLYLKLWYTGHYFPSYFTPHQWYHFALISTFFIVFFQKCFDRCAGKEKVRIFLFTLAAMWIAAYVFGEIVPVRGIILLQFLRSDVIFITLGIIFAADYIRSYFEGNSIKGAAIGGLAILALIEFSEPSYKEFILAALLLVSYESGIKKFLKKISSDPDRAFNMLLFLSGMLLAAFSGISFIAYNGSPKMLCMLVFSVMLVMSVRSRQSIVHSPKSVSGIITIAVLIVAALSFVHLFEYRIFSGNISNLFDQKDADWKDPYLSTG
jgi:hypothetical protein